MNVGALLKKFQRRRNIVCCLEIFLVNILMKKVVSFCYCPKSLPKAKAKSFGSILLTEGISKQPSICSVLWLLVFMLIKIYNEKV